MKNHWLRAVVCVLVLGGSSAATMAQPFDIGPYLPNGEASTAGRILQLMALITVLSLAPGILMMVTSFTRFVIALSFLRAGLGLQTTPGNLVLISFSLFLTMFVMASTFESAWIEGVKPMIENKITTEQGYEKITSPFRKFMTANVRSKDLDTFQALAKDKFATNEVTAGDDFRILIPAYMVSELRRGFEIGFLIALPFVVIDLVVATVVMSMGMMMMPPTIISMPLKVLFFVLIDGWSLLAGTLTKSFIL